MKKLAALVLLTVFILLLASTALAGKFNRSALEKSDLYIFNKFDKSWKIIGAYN